MTVVLIVLVGKDAHPTTTRQPEKIQALVAWKATLQRQYQSKRTQQWKKKFYKHKIEFL